MENAGGVLAVCVNYNGRDVLADLLRSLMTEDCPELRVLVVDSASKDGSCDLLPAGASILRLTENRGYAAALNAGIRAALSNSGSAPDYFLLLNNDLVFRPGAVRRLIDFARSRGPSVVGPKVLRADRPERLDAAWGEVSWTHVLARFHGRNALDSERFSRIRPAELLLGCALLVHREVFSAVGLFDESFFMYHEEVDFLYRCRLAGIPIFFCPLAAVLHRGGWGTRRDPFKKTFWLRKNTILFFRKHRPRAARWARLAATLSASALWNLVTLRWGRLRAIVGGAAAGWSSPRA